jgi:hypothetical protein
VPWEAQEAKGGRLSSQCTLVVSPPHALAVQGTPAGSTCQPTLPKARQLHTRGDRQNSTSALQRHRGPVPAASLQVYIAAGHAGSARHCEKSMHTPLDLIFFCLAS